MTQAYSRELEFYMIRVRKVETSLLATLYICSYVLLSFQLIHTG